MQILAKIKLTKFKYYYVSKWVNTVDLNGKILLLEITYINMIIYIISYIHIIYIHKPIICSVQLLSCIQLFVTPTAARQAASSAPKTCSNSRPLNQWRSPAISSSVIPFSSCLQFFPASGSFPRSQFFASGGQSTGVSAFQWLFRTDFL